MRACFVVALMFLLVGTKANNSCNTPILYRDDNVTEQPHFSNDTWCSPRPSEYEMCRYKNSQDMHEVLRALMEDHRHQNDLFYYIAHSKDGSVDYSCYKANATYDTDKHDRVTFTLSFGTSVYKYKQMKSGAFELWVDRGCYFKHFKSFAFPTCVNGVISTLDCRLDKDDEVDATVLGRLSTFHDIKHHDIEQTNREFPLLNFFKEACDHLL